MPRWDLRCTECGATTEHFFLSAAERDEIVPLLHCWNDFLRDVPCSGSLEVLPASGSFVLKGSGFHVNDYKKG